jgi:hypothetical protein
MPLAVNCHYFIILTITQLPRVKMIKEVKNQIMRSAFGTLNIKYVGNVKNTKYVPSIRSAK